MTVIMVLSRNDKWLIPPEDIPMFYEQSINGSIRHGAGCNLCYYSIQPVKLPIQLFFLRLAASGSTFAANQDFTVTPNDTKQN